MKKRIPPLLYTLIAIIITITFTASGITKTIQNTNDDTYTSYTDFIQIMNEIKDLGDQVAELGLPVQSEYYYSFAGASIGALRYAAEYVLWLKGEGNDFASFTADSHYSGWSTIAEINYSSPYPSYFEGLLLDIQGKYEEALQPYIISSIMPYFPEEGLDFSYLKGMDITSLYTLRDNLRALEADLYKVYTPKITGAQWDRYNFDSEYLRASSQENINIKDYQKALHYAKLALKADPFDVLNWRNACFCALAANEYQTMGEYLDEAIVIFPEDEQLITLRQAIIDTVSKKQVL